MVRRKGSRLEACHHPSVCFCNVCVNVESSLKLRSQNIEQPGEDSEREDQPREQSRTTRDISVFWGDVGTEAHIRKKDVVEDEKEKEKDAALEDKEKDLEERTRTNSLGEV